MKSFISRSVLVILLLVSSLSVHASTVDKVSSALKQGDANALSSFFNNSVELVVLDKEGIYSSDQAKVIVSSFFSENRPSGFKSIHTGGKPEATYVIGNLDTSSGQFRVYFLIKGEVNAQKIYQLRFEKE